MTIIFAIGNSDQVIQISDRRLTGGGRILAEEANKAALIISDHARLTLGFTGIASYQGFDVFKWLLIQLHEAAPPDFNISDTINRFVVRITERFSKLHELRTVNPKDKALSLIFSGYIYPNGLPKLAFCVVSNYFNAATGNTFESTSEEFNVCFYENSMSEANPILLQRIGNWRGVCSEDEDRLRKAALERLPARAITDIGFSVVSSIADRMRSSGSIGRQITSISIPSDMSVGAKSGYHSAIIKPETYMPAIVYLMPKQHLTVDNINVAPVDKNSPPLSVPKVKRGHPCPCGSNLQYRNCHGQHR